MKFKLNGRIWIEGEERFMGIGRFQLLEQIEQTGSISAAAKKMEMSYKRAWDLVQSMNSQSETPVLSTQAGGERGGGTHLTEEGKRWVTLYSQFQQRFQEFLETETLKLPAE